MKVEEININHSKYEFLANEFSNKLNGIVEQLTEDNNVANTIYNITYNNNVNVKWEDILTEESSLINGVIRVDGGSFEKYNNISTTINTMHIEFLIPTDDLKFFNKNITIIEQTFKNYHGVALEFNEELLTLLYNSQSDSKKITVNGIDYGLIIVNLSVLSYDNIILGNQCIIKIDGEKLNGAFNGIYQNTHTTDGVVLGFNSPIQENRLNGIQKTLSCDILIDKNDLLHKKLMEDEDEDKEYLVTYNNGVVERTMKMYLINIVESIIPNSPLKVKVSFGIKGV